MSLTKEQAQTDEGIRFINDLTSGKKIYRAYGILGEIPGSDAYVDEEIKPEGGGKFLKLYGISYLFKGNPHQVQVHGLELAKSLIFNFPKEIAKRSWMLSIAIGFQFIIRKRRFLEFIDWIFEEINHKVIRHLDMPLKEYNEPVREIKRAITVSLQEEFNIDLNKPYYDVEHPRFRPERRLPDPDDNKNNPKFLGYLIARIEKFVCFFLELDNAYRFRIQDAFGLLNKENAKKHNGYRELYRILDILINRETKTGVPHKWKMIKMMARISFFFIPKLKKFVRKFLINLDISKVKMDDADWFFCLTYHSYNFGGFSKKERFLTRKAINQEKKHQWLIGYEDYSKHIDEYNK